MDAVQLFDLPSGPTIYRVFLLPGCLQFDLSFAPASEFAPLGPKFRLPFGSAVEKLYAPPPSAEALFGYAVHPALRARFCSERGRYWQAEYWISGVRDYALSLACRRHDLPATHGRGFDDLPAEVLEAFDEARGYPSNERSCFALWGELSPACCENHMKFVNWPRRPRLSYASWLSHWSDCSQFLARSDDSSVAWASVREVFPDGR